jgi:hypothetical protein
MVLAISSRQADPGRDAGSLEGSRHGYRRALRGHDFANPELPVAGKGALAAMARFPVPILMAGTMALTMTHPRKA